MDKRNKRPIKIVLDFSYGILYDLLMKVKLQVCQHCGCIPKPDEWSSETLCIDCVNTF